MTPKTVRLIVGFLACFVLISIAPAIPDFIANLSGGTGLQIPAISDTTLLAIGAAVLLLGLIVLQRKQRRVRAAQPVTRSRSQALARPSADKPLKRSMPEHSGPYPTIPSPLQIRLRAAVDKGERIPVLARRHNISVDAVRTAVGATATSAPAARPSTSFRSSAPSLPAKPRARAVAQHVSRYQPTS